MDRLPAARTLIPAMMLCPTCGRPIPPEDINIAQDVAMCRACNAVMSVSGAVHGTNAPVSSPTPIVFDPAAPPPGAWYHDDGVETVIGATTRSPAAVFLVPFFLVWGGGSLGGIYGSQIASGKFDPILSLFGLIFVAGSCAIGSFAMMSLCGKVEVRMRQGQGTVFVGVGPFGWRKRFETPGTVAVREDWAGWSRGKRPQRSIIVEGVERLKFGSMLTSERRAFVMEGLRRVLNPGA